jgi:toxin FitB
MPRFLVDTNCIVAALQPEHPDKDRAVGEINRRLGARETMVVAAHSLVEAYSVLTRVPRLLRITPHGALAAIQQSFIERAEIVALDESGYVPSLRQTAEDGLAGGRVYDAVIAACAVRARVDAVLTFNERHFRPLLPDSIEVVVPSE